MGRQRERGLATLGRAATEQVAGGQACAGSLVVPGPPVALYDAFAPIASVEVDAAAVLPDELPPGTRVGEYRIERKIAAGGMGTVYGAVQPLIQKRVAIKVIAAALCGQAAAIERFVREARLVNRIGHPNIVDIFGFGGLPDGRHYFVMERLAGQSLAERMRAAPLSPTQSIEVLLQICAALDAVHAEEVVHRDLKPQNIFLAHVGELVVVKLLDFGIAKLHAGDRGNRLTSTGTFVGTAMYVAPEQARDTDVDHRADLYSLGVIAYELLVGRVPFAADNVADLVAMHLHATPPRPRALRPDLPRSVERLILSLLAKSPDKRPSLDRITATLRRARRSLRSAEPPPPARSGMAAGSAATIPRPRASSDAETAPRRRLPARRWPARLFGLLLVVASGIGAAALVTGRVAIPAGGATPAASVAARAHAPADRRQALAEVTVQTNVPGAYVAIGDQQLVASRRGMVSAVVTAGIHEVVARARGHQPARARLVVAGGGTSAQLYLAPLEVDVDAEPGTEPAAPRTEPDQSPPGAKTRATAAEPEKKKKKKRRHSRDRRLPNRDRSAPRSADTDAPMDPFAPRG